MQLLRTVVSVCIAPEAVRSARAHTFIVAQNVVDMWLVARSVYTTLNSRSPPCRDSGIGPV